MYVTYHAAEANRSSIWSKRNSRDRKLQSPQYIITENLFNKPKQLDHVAWLVLLDECVFPPACTQHLPTTSYHPSWRLKKHCIAIIENTIES